MCSRMPSDTAVQNWPDAVSSTETHLVTSSAPAENIRAGIISLILGVALISAYQ